MLSSLRIAWLTALGVKCNSSAASLKDPVRAAASKARIAEIGILDSSIPMSEPDSHIQDNCAFVPEMPWAYQMRSRRSAAYKRRRER